MVHLDTANRSAPVGSAIGRRVVPVPCIGGVVPAGVGFQLRPTFRGQSHRDTLTLAWPNTAERKPAAFNDRPPGTKLWRLRERAVLLLAVCSMTAGVCRISSLVARPCEAPNPPQMWREQP